MPFGVGYPPKIDSMQSPSGDSDPIDPLDPMVPVVQKAKPP